jgi:uncharacterized protein YbjQ (UPF0145 family)
MIITTIDSVPGSEIAAVLGVARGNTVRARNFGRDIIAGLKNVIGGEISEYTKLIADAVINMRFTTSMIMQGSAEILAYGTAVKLK